MGVLLYAPQVQLVIATDSGTFDVSQDIVSGQCTLIENQSHQMQCVLLNKGRRYDKLFKPNDRFALYLKRLQKLLIMTGYLDTVPMYSVWPRSIQISGQSTLKRLQYHWWDPGTPASVNLFNTAGNVTSAQTGSSDTSLVTKATALLTNVANWNASEIHFSALPSDWISKVASLWESVAPQIGLNPSAALGTMPLISGNSPFDSGVTTLNFFNPASEVNGQPIPGSALPADFGTAIQYQGGKDVQNVSSWYCQMQWGYQNPDGTTPAGVSPAQVKNFLKGARLMVGNPDANTAVIVQVAGWGPPAGANGQIGLSPDAYKALGITGSNNQVQVAWVINPATGTAPTLGVYNPSTENGVQGSTTQPTTGLNGTNRQNLGLAVSTPNQAMPLQFDNTVYTSSQPPYQNQSARAQTAVIAGIDVVNKGVPYVWGGGHSGPYAPGSPILSGYDCSGFVSWCWNQAGVPIAGTSESLYATLTPLPADPSTWLPGDLLFYGGGDGSIAQPGHVTMFIGQGQMVQAPQTGQDVQISAASYDGAGYGGFSGARRITAANASGSTAAANLPGSSGAANSSTQSFDSAWTWFANQTEATDPLSTALTGYRALMNDTPFLPTVQMVINATMRSFCAAPNGDLIAWFPDYFNVYNTLGVVRIADVELQDFTVNWSDLSMVTHQYAAGTYSPYSVGSTVGGAVTDLSMITTGGVATIDFPQILQSLFNLDPNDPTFSTAGLYTRFGARPNFISLGTLYGELAEFWFALYMFQYNWSTQFAANIPISFMPELYPGMIMQVPSQNVQVYVQQVQHTWNLNSNGGGFTTQATVCAPSAINNAGLYGFAKGSSVA